MGFEAAGVKSPCSGEHHDHHGVPADVGAGLPPALPRRGRLFRLPRPLLGFLAFFGIYASSSVCPFCGTPGCPVGAGGAMAVGGIFTLLWEYGARLWKAAAARVQKWFRRTSSTP